MKKCKKGTNRPLMQREVVYQQGVEVEEAIEIARHCFFQDNEMQIMERTLRNVNDYRTAYWEMIKYWNYERYLAEIYERTGRESLKYYGLCEVCNTMQALVVDYRSAQIQNGRRIPNWRERLVCPNCGCNSRQRFILRTIFENYRLGMEVLLYEQASTVYEQVRSEIPSVKGFEYLGEGYKKGGVYNRIVYQDVCELSFEDETFDLIISNDVFEHVRDYGKAFREVYRVLKPGGKLIFTVPFDANSMDTTHRAEIQDGKIVYYAEKLYHDNPVAEYPPLLVYQIFGWDLLDTIKKSGFSDAYGKAFYGMKEGYLGYLPMYFEAYK